MQDMNRQRDEMDSDRKSQRCRSKPIGLLHEATAECKLKEQINDGQAKKWEAF
jgi:hypothetical protein